jgi:hypothetical protein
MAEISSQLDKGKKNLLHATKTAGPRLWDAFMLFVWSNVLFGPGHIFMLPIALADGAVGVNEFRKAAGMKPLAKNQALEQFLAKAKATIDHAKINADTWAKPVRWMRNLGLATLAAGIVIHPLAFVGLALAAFPNLLRDVGITFNVFKQLLTQGKTQAKTSVS